MQKSGIMFRGFTTTTFKAHNQQKSVKDVIFRTSPALSTTANVKAITGEWNYTTKGEHTGQRAKEWENYLLVRWVDSTTDEDPQRFLPCCFSGLLLTPKAPRWFLLSVHFPFPFCVSSSNFFRLPLTAPPPLPIISSRILPSLSLYPLAFCSFFL